MTKQDKEYLEALMDAQFVKFGTEFAKVNAAVDIVNIKIDDVIMPKLKEIETHAKETNGRVTELENNTIRVPKNKRWRVAGILLIVAFVIGLVSAVSYHKINWKQTFENKTKVELKES